MAMLRALLKGLGDILYPRVCLACKNKITEASVDNLVCNPCWQRIKRNLPPFCQRCGRHLDIVNSLGNLCRGCAEKIFYFDRAFSPCIYEGIIKELIHAFKYNGKEHLGFTLSRLMVDFIREYDLAMETIHFLVPIPLHKIRLREREFNQAQILGNFLAREFNKDTLNNILIRHRATKTQTELATEVRLLNVKGGFSIRDNNLIKDKNILLIDDVLTTGATASEASCALKEAGANKVLVLTLAS